MTQRTVTPQIGRAYVRVLGKQLGKFIEFEFFLNDDDLCVELVMPESAFQEFCDYYDAEILPSEDAGTDASQGKVAGLYRAPADTTAQ